METIDWHSATDEAREWGGFSLVIDTNTYAGSIEREMLAACTGVTEEYATDEAEALAAVYNGPDFRELDLLGSVLYDPGDDGFCRTGVTIYPTLGHPEEAFNSVRIVLTRELTTEELDEIKRRALSFAATEGFQITGFRYVRERTAVQSVAV